ncbi:MAG: hypothetical protein C4562_02655 [Actinobacteria bacterium]|nr:MAG: hypothetical protein C4562_02655 [Actinomycetota bacterium]
MSGQKTKPKERKLIFLGVLLVLMLFALFQYLWYGEGPDTIFLTRPRYLFSIYGSDKLGPLNQPVSVATVGNRLFVADSGNARIAVFDTRGRPLFSFKQAGKDKLKYPSYLAIKNDRLYVSDSGLGSIFVFDTDGQYIRRFTPKADEKFSWSPLALTFDDNGNLFVTDKGYNRVLKFNNSSRLVLDFGKTAVVNKVNEKLSHFYFANGLALDNDNNIIVSDSNNRRIQVFDSNGKFTKLIPVAGLPRGIIYTMGKLFVVNGFKHQVEAYNLSGKMLFSFGEIGSAKGQFQYPNDIKFARRHFYIVDSGNNRVQVWMY